LKFALNEFNDAKANLDKLKKLESTSEETYRKASEALDKANNAGTANQTLKDDVASAYSNMETAKQNT
jgi:hypothetical protein